MSAENKALVHLLVNEAINAGRLAVTDRLVASDHAGHDPALPEETRGPAGVKALIAACRDAFPDIRVTIQDQIDVGDRVVTRWRARGTHEGELFGIPATGRQVTVTGITITRIVGSHIAESWNHWDTLGLVQQLGAAPVLATA